VQTDGTHPSLLRMYAGWARSACSLGAFVRSPRSDDPIRYPPLTTGKPKMDIMSLARASRGVSAGRFQFLAMNLRIEVWSMTAWSIEPRLENGEIANMGTRNP